MNGLTRNDALCVWQGPCEEVSAMNMPVGLIVNHKASSLSRFPRIQFWTVSRKGWCS